MSCPLARWFRSMLSKTRGDIRARSLFARLRRPRLLPRLALLAVDVVGEAEHPLGDDVALHLRGATADREGASEQEPVVPAVLVGSVERTAIGEHALGAGQVLGQLHELLPVLVGEQLADRRLGAGRLPLHGGGDRAQANEPEDLGLDVERSETLA